MYAPGASISVRFVFEERGAPMPLLSGENETDENGIVAEVEITEEYMKVNLFQLILSHLLFALGYLFFQIS